MADKTLPIQEQAERMLHEQMNKAALPEWLIEMREHYAKTGTYRPQDLRRLLGDPNRRVESGPNPSLASFLGRG